MISRATRSRDYPMWLVWSITLPGSLSDLLGVQMGYSALPYALKRLFEVLRFELMIKRGLCEQPQPSGKEAQRETLCRTGRLRERDNRLHRG